jgi:DNA topoisomerase IB
MPTLTISEDTRVLFLKAQAKEGLVTQERPHKGYTDKNGVYHAPHQQRHGVRLSDQWGGSVSSKPAHSPDQGRLSTGMLADIVAQAVDQFNHQPPIVMLDSLADVTGRADDRGRAAGMVHQGRIYLFRDELADVFDARRTLWHELFHYGLRRLLTQDQYIQDMHRLLATDGYLSGRVERWLGGEDAAGVRKWAEKRPDLAGRLEDYVRARGADEVLAGFAESIGEQRGPFRNEGVKGRAVRTIIGWMAGIADRFRWPDVGNWLRGLSSATSRRYVHEIFKKLQNDEQPSVDDWAFTSDPAFSKSTLKSVTYTITKIGRKWLYGKAPGKNYEVQIELNDQSRDWKIGEQKTFSATVEYESSRYGATTKVYPASDAEKKAADAEKKAADVAKQSSEIDRWLGYVEEKAPTGYLYQNGVAKLRELGIEKFPEQAQRLQAAIATVEKIKQGAAKEKADRAAKEKKEKADREQARLDEVQSSSVVWLSVPFEEKDIAKRHGAKWSPEQKSWYVLGKVPAELKRYAPHELQEGERWISGGEGYDNGIYTKVGDVIRYNGGYYKVVHTAHKYYKYDGMSFGVGQESGYVFNSVIRRATEEESAPLRKDDEEAGRKREGWRQSRALAEWVKGAGELPEGHSSPKGDVVLSFRPDLKAYGGGSWWVIGSDFIWYVQNNGADGSDWSLNNVTTGGAGGIGWRIPHDPLFEARLRIADDWAHGRTPNPQWINIVNAVPPGKMVSDPAPDQDPSATNTKAAQDARENRDLFGGDSTDAPPAVIAPKAAPRKRGPRAVGSGSGQLDLFKSGLLRVLFFKAQAKGTAERMDDLFGDLVEKDVQHQGYTDKNAVYHAPHQQRHKVHVSGGAPGGGRSAYALALAEVRDSDVYKDKVGREGKVSADKWANGVAKRHETRLSGIEEELTQPKIVHQPMARLDVNQRVQATISGATFTGTIKEIRNLETRTDGCLEYRIKLDSPLTMYGTERTAMIVYAKYDGSPSNYTKFTEELKAADQLPEVGKELAQPKPPSVEPKPATVQPDNAPREGDRNAEGHDPMNYTSRAPTTGTGRFFVHGGELSASAEPLAYGARLRYRLLIEHPDSGYRAIDGRVTRDGDRFFLTVNPSAAHPMKYEVSATPTAESIERQHGFDAAIIDAPRNGKVPKRHAQQSSDWMDGYRAALDAVKDADPQDAKDYRERLAGWLKDSAPREGDRNAEGLVLRNGRWHREDEPETPSNLDRLRAGIEALGGKAKAGEALRAMRKTDPARVDALVADLAEKTGTTRAEALAELGIREVVRKERKSAAPAPVKAADPEAAYDDLGPSSPNYRYRDTGYVAGSRKENAANLLRTAKRSGGRVRGAAIDWEDLERNPREAKEVITKSHLFGSVDWEGLKAGGMEPGTGFLVDRVYASVGAEPKDNTLAKALAAPGGRRVLFLKAWDESKHPRGQKGQFARTGLHRVSRTDVGEWVHHATGAPISPEAAHELRRIGVPPGAAEVHLNPDESSPLRAISVDVKGRQHWHYTAAHTAENSGQKFERLDRFVQAAHRIIRAIAPEIQRSDAAAVLYLIARTGIRIGSDADTGAARKAYGASTLLVDHVSFASGRAILQFPAKSGKDAYKVVEDRALVALLQQKVQGKSAGAKLWRTNERAIRDLLKREGHDDSFEVKDFRTWHGTELAKKLIAKLSKPMTDKEKARKKRIIATAVAQRLGNTPAMALASYINPKVWNAWEST